MSSNSTEWIHEAHKAIIDKVKKTSLVIGSELPTMTQDGIYNYSKDYKAWTTGFWPGLLWLLYKDTQYEPFMELARVCEEKVATVLNDFVDLDHDMGFIWSLTAVNHYEICGNPVSRNRALAAASHLAGRFNIVGRYLRAWNYNDVNDGDIYGLSIIDSMMNLPLLFWASQKTSDPRFKHIAIAHADSVVENFIREDGSVNHMVEFDPYTGHKKRILSGQGYSAESAWSRGTSWALYGMASTYKHTKDLKYLEVAKKVASFFVSQLPEDSIPHWDFTVERTATTARDTSAAACAACGLLELSALVPEAEKHLYEQPARAIVQSIYENYGNWSKDDQEGLISGGTFNHPQGLGIDISLIYGDYYFTEAVCRLRMKTKEAIKTA